MDDNRPQGFIRLAADTLMHHPLSRVDSPANRQLEGRSSPHKGFDSEQLYTEEDAEGFTRSISLYWNWIRLQKAASRLGRVRYRACAI